MLMFVLADPDVTIAIGSVLGCVMVLFIISVIVYYIYKVDIVLWFRTAFPVLYVNKGNVPQSCVFYYTVHTVVDQADSFILYTYPSLHVFLFQIWMGGCLTPMWHIQIPV